MAAAHQLSATPRDGDVAQDEDESESVTIDQAHSAAMDKIETLLFELRQGGGIQRYRG